MQLWEGHTCVVREDVDTHLTCKINQINPGNQWCDRRAREIPSIPVDKGDRCAREIPSIPVGKEECLGGSDSSVWPRISDIPHWLRKID